MIFYLPLWVTRARRGYGPSFLIGEIMLTLIVLGFGCAIALWSREHAEKEDRKFYEDLKKKQMEAIMKKLQEEVDKRKAP